MNCFLLQTLAASCLAASGQKPAGVSAYSCPNYPYCSGGNTLSLTVPNVPGAANVINSQEALIRGNLAPLPMLLLKLLSLNRVLEASWLTLLLRRFCSCMQQVRVLNGLNHEELQHFQAEAVFCANEHLVFSFMDKNVISFAGASFFCQLEIN